MFSLTSNICFSRHFNLSDVNKNPKLNKFGVKGKTPFLNSKLMWWVKLSLTGVN